MRIQIFTFFALLSSFCFAQSKLTGFVREQNTGIKIGGVMVKSNGTSNSIESNSSGDFILKFQDLKPGKNIIVRAEKDGWELVNEKEMSTLIPENPDEKPFKIILCKAGTLAKAKSKYYETFELNLQKEFDKQKALNKGNARKIASLEQDFERIQKQLNDLADEYSRIDLSDASEKDLKAIELFKDGKYDEFISLKKSIVTEAQVDKAVKNKVEALKTIDNSDSTINLYYKSQKDIVNTLVLQFKFDEAEKTYEKLVLKDTTNYKNAFGFANFLADQNKHDKAIQWFNLCLRIAKKLAKKNPVIYELSIASNQNNLGNLYNNKNNFPAAESAYLEALKIYERLVKTNIDYFESLIALTQNNLGFLYRNYKINIAADSAYVDYFESLVALTQTNLGVLYRNNKKNTAAESAYLEALGINSRLAKTNSAVYEPALANTLNNLGVLYVDLKNYLAAESAYFKALEIRRRLAETKTDINNSDLAQTQTNLGILYLLKNNYPAAGQALLEALEIRKPLVKKNPYAYEPAFAITLANLAIVYSKQKNSLAAESAYLKALEIRKRLTIIDATTYEPDLATILNNLGVLYFNMKIYRAADSAYHEALKIRKRLATINPGTYEPDLADTKFNFGNLYLETKNYPAAESALQEAIKIYKQWAKTNPGIYESNLAKTQYSFGNFYSDQSNFPAAKLAYFEALKIFKGLAKTEVPVYEPDIARTQLYLGNLYYNNKDYLGAEPAFLEALEIYKRLARINPGTYDSDVTITEANLRDTYLRRKLKKIDELELKISNATVNNAKINLIIEIIREYHLLINSGDSVLADELGISYGNLAWLQLLEKQFANAEQSAREALNPQTFKKNEGYDASVMWVGNANLALALLFQGKYGEAEKIYNALKDKPYEKGTYKDTFLADLNELEKAGITHPDVVKIRNLLKKK